MENMNRTIIWYPGHDLLVPDIERADNCSLYDSKGKRYVDLESGVWCTSIGHGNQKVLRVIQEQSARIAHAGFNYSNRIVEEAAQDVLSLLGLQGGKCVFLCSGSEAVEYIVRTAQSVIVRPLLMTMMDSYLGAYGSARQRREDEWYCFDWAPCEACESREECGDWCTRWKAIPFEEIGGFLFEPGSSSGLVRFPPEKLIRTIVAVIKESGGCVLVNEVTTGIGRTGSWFGYQHYGISPDMVALGKGIGNGYPVSVASIAPAISKHLEKKPIQYSQSHQNDPLGAAIVRTVIEVIEKEGLIARSGDIAAALLSGIMGIKDRTGRIREIRARGLMIAIELEDDERTAVTIRTHRAMVDRGYIMGKRPGLNVLRLDPSLTIDQKDIEGFLSAFEVVLENLA